MSVIDQACGQIRTLIVSGDLAPGERAAELPLAARLGVSRPTVREALRRLESSQLLRPDARGGLSVAGLAAHELRSILLTRSSLEGLHAGLVARRVRRGEVAPAQLRHLIELAEAADRATRQGLHQQAVLDNRAFHQTLDSLADSPVSAAILDGLWDRIIVSTRRSLLAPDRPPTVDAEHHAVLAAVEGGHVRQASEAASEHVLATLEAALAADP